MVGANTSYTRWSWKSSFADAASMYCQATQTSRGFAFVQFENQTSMELVLKESESEGLKWALGWTRSWESLFPSRFLLLRRRIIPMTIPSTSNSVRSRPSRGWRESQSRSSNDGTQVGTNSKTNLFRLFPQYECKPAVPRIRTSPSASAESCVIRSKIKLAKRSFLL